jgi:hydroxymethylpyrimidine/phosphomethylpyrimidine kinase
MSAVTALTAQNTRGVLAVFPTPADFVALQIRACLDDIGADAVKTGMLANAGIVNAVADALAPYKGLKLVVDPVLAAKSGDRLLAGEAETALKERLLPLATVVTPNLPEAEALTGMALRGIEDMRRAAQALREMGPGCVVVKGGHLAGDEALDLFYDGCDFVELTGPRLSARHTHGTGCTFSAALATGLAKGLAAVEAARLAKRFVTEAIRHGLPLGRGCGPTDPLAAARVCGVIPDSKGAA